MARAEFGMTQEAAQREAAALLANIDGITAVNVREGLVDGFVDLDRIRPEPVVVDDSHVEKLVGLFEKARGDSPSDTGQMLPIILAEVPSEKQLLIADGFHRTATLAKIGASAAYATVKPNCTMEEVYDLRILATSDHKAIEFARISEWINSAWETTPWNNWITVLQAFVLQSQDPQKRANTAGRLGISERTANSIVKWANEKCSQWQLPASTIQSNLVTTQRADPELVKQVRAVRGNVGVLKPRQLTAIANELPGEYTLQQIVAAHAVHRNMRWEDVRVLARRISGARSTEEADNIINSASWQGASKSKPTGRQYNKATPQYTRRVLEASQRTVQPETSAEASELASMLVDAELTIGRLAIANANLSGRIAPEDDVAMPQMTSGQRDLMERSLPSLTELERRTTILATCFRLRPEIIANVLGVQLEEIKEAIVGIGKKIKS